MSCRLGHTDRLTGLFKNHKVAPPAHINNRFFRMAHIMASMVIQILIGILKIQAFSWLTHSTRPGSCGWNSWFRRTNNLRTSNRFRNDFWSLSDLWHIFFFFFLWVLYRRSSAIILLVFHSRPVLDHWATLCGGSTQRPFSLVPLAGFEPMQAQPKQQVPTP